MFSLVAWIAAAYAQSCGDTLSTPNAVVTLTADIVCPPGHTGHILRINADNVTIDGNGFRLVGAGVGTTSNGVLVNARDDATIQNLIIEGATNGVNLANSDRARVLTVTASGLSRGVTSSGANPRLTVSNVDVRNNTIEGMRLVGTDGALILELNDFGGSAEGLALVNTNGPWTLAAAAGNQFSGVASAGSTSADVITLSNADDVTLDGLDLSGSGFGRGVLVSSSERITLRDLDASSRHRGVTASGSGVTGLTITRVNVSDAADFGMHLTAVDNTLVLTDNTFDRADQGLYLQNLIGPWTFPTSNSFVDVPFASDSDDVIELHQVAAITIADLDLSADTAGRGHAIRLENADDVVIERVIARDRRVGVVLDNDTVLGVPGTNAGLVIRDTDLSGATLRALQLAHLADSPTLDGIAADDAVNGVLIEDTESLAGLTIDVGGITFAGVAPGSSNYWVRAEDVSGLTLQNLLADTATTGRVVQLVRADDTVIDDVQVCGAARGVSLEDSDNVVLGGVSVGVSAVGVYVDANSDFATGALGALGNTTDVTSLNPSTSIAITPLPDADGNNIPNICDTCPTDPLNDLDNDGLCADVDDDDDGDDVLDVDDPAPNDASVCGDSDLDTCDDCSVANLLAPLDDGLDTDSDGACDLGDPDDDGDGALDVDDSDPLDPLACSDDDLDGCDDCTSGSYDLSGDGVDSDGDSVCDPADLLVDDPALFSNTDFELFGGLPWSPGGVGSPSVVFDSASGLFVMVYETQVGTHSDCPVGVWALGLATSTDGRSWTDQGQLVEPVPQSGTYWECVTAHPSVVDRAPGLLTVFFKTEQGSTPAGTPAWGTGQYTGLGRVAVAWNAATSSYGATAPDSSPALAIGTNFGYPKALFAGGEYRVALSRRPEMLVASGPATSLTLDGVAWAPGDATWTPDEVYNPAPICDDGAFAAFVGGREIGVGGATVWSALGRLASTDFVTWGEGPGPMLSTQAGDLEFRHWDVLPAGGGEYLLFFSNPNGPGGSNQVGLAATAGADLAAVQSKVCP